MSAAWLGGGLRRGLLALSETCRVPAAVRHNSKACKPDLVVQLKTHYPGLGFEGDFCRVRPGFARNYLVPQGHARLLDHFEKKAWKAIKDAEDLGQRQETSADAQMKATLANLPQVIDRLTTHTLVLRGFPGPSGVQRPLTADNIVAQLKKQFKVTLPVESVELRQPLTSFGEHLVPVYLDPQYAAAGTKLKVQVVDARTKKRALPATKPKKTEDEDFEFGDSEDEYYEVVVDRRRGKAPSAIPSTQDMPQEN